MEEHKDSISPDLLLCNTAKGLYLEQNCLLSEAINRSLNRDQPYAILSGPSFAKEIMMNFPTAGLYYCTDNYFRLLIVYYQYVFANSYIKIVVVASKYLYHAVKIQRIMTSLYFRVYATQDVIGVQLGGALKNPLAIGAGIIEGTGMGINTMAAYLTRSSLELQALCKAMGGEPQTISGLSGVGGRFDTSITDLLKSQETVFDG